MSWGNYDANGDTPKDNGFGGQAKDAWGQDIKVDPWTGREFIRDGLGNKAYCDGDKKDD